MQKSSNFAEKTKLPKTYQNYQSYQKLLKVKQNVTKRECIPCNASRCLSC